MWADTLLRAEQQHLLYLLFWAGLSILAGTFVAVLLAVRRIRSTFLAHFAGQMALWGAVIAAIAIVQWRGLHLRDLSSAARLERMVWMNVGLSAGYALAGAVLVGSGWLLARRLGAVGAGVAIVAQGLALLLIDLQFAGVISR